MKPLGLKSTSVLAGVGLLLFGAASGCDRSTPEKGADAQNQVVVNSELPANIFVASAPQGARPVRDAKDASPGDRIVVHGRIGGGKSPFVDGRAIFTLSDMSLPPCSEKEDDHCPTPWDFCCEPLDDILRRTITVRVVDPAGQPVKSGLKGAGGLRELSEVVVEGRVSSKSPPHTLVVDASAICLMEKKADTRQNAKHDGTDATGGNR